VSHKKNDIHVALACYNLDEHESKHGALNGRPTLLSHLT